MGNKNFAQLVLAAFGLTKEAVSTTEMMKRQKMADNNMGHRATAPHGAKLRGPGFTRASHEESKTRRKMAARSRKINRRK